MKKAIAKRSSAARASLQRIRFSFTRKADDEIFSEDARKIIDPRSISLRAIKELRDEVLSGEAAASVELYVAKRDLSDKVKKGATIQALRTRANGTLQGRVPYVGVPITFEPGKDADPNAVIFFDQWDVPAPLQRAWCVWEIMGAITQAQNFEVVITPGQEQAFVEALLEDVHGLAKIMADNNNMRNAKCWKKEDKEMIDKAIEATVEGGYVTLIKEVNRRVHAWRLKMARDAVLEARSGDGDARKLADILVCTAELLKSQGEYIEALHMLEEALSIRKECLGDRHPSVAQTLNNIAGVYRNQGRYEEALAYYEEALSIRKESLGDRHPSVASTLYNIANVYKAQGRYEEALACYEEALSIRKESLGDRHPLVATTLNNIAGMYYNQGRHEEALAYYEEALSIRKECLGDRHPSVATTLNNIASVYDNQGRYKEALAYYEENLSISKESLGDRHPSVATTLHKIAGVYDDQGRYEEALAYYEEDLSISKEILGDRHPDVAITFSNIATVYYNQGRYEEALAFYEEALSIRKESLGDRHPDVATTLNNIAGVYGSQGRYEEALAYYEEALSIRKENLGDRHPDVAGTINNIAGVYYNQGRYEEALAYYEEALSIYKERLGDRHPYVAIAQTADAAGAARSPTSAGPSKLEAGEAAGEDYGVDEDGLPHMCSNDEERMKLVDAAFDEIGIGRYHAAIFVSASLGFFVEAAEMSILPLLIAKFSQEWEVTDRDLSMLPSVTAIGMVTGTLIFGRLSDLVGRKVVYHTSLSLCVVFGYISSFTTSIQVFAATRMFMGFGYGGNLVSAATLLLESIPTAYRGLFSALTTFSFTFGGIFISFFSYLLMDAWGWESIVRTTSLLGLPVCIFLFFMPGSVRFYIMNKRYENAVGVVERIAKVNGKPMPRIFTLARLRGIEDAAAGALSSPTGETISARKSCVTYMGLMTILDSRVLRILLPLMTIWFLNSFAYALFSFLPLELNKRFGDVDKAPYKISMALSVGGFIGSLAVTFLSTRMKRLSELRLGLTLVAASTMVISQITSSFLAVCAVLMVSHTGVSIIYHALYTYTPETFPTSVRVTAFSACHLSHRLAPIIAPFGVTALTSRSFTLAAVCYASLWFVAAGVSLTLHRETLNQPMVESLDEFSDGQTGSHRYEHVRNSGTVVAEDTPLTAPSGQVRTTSLANQ
ncbi:Solute carrier family 22 member 15 [Hondaea fermentalgiana]|uniref:Solute carrier family 22 member 15 n=1 Tax=Hondaea fermentalgiana TaxID=2315210 RepID=A0A2R5GPI8_9STRA|nr:Solute carrier family 22 member 15 [Hondaea fermentalgiana]|eukprot:GBG32535.1 Solute carrier family 22 member 15 [Hondaea fermentalgiana]